MGEPSFISQPQALPQSHGLSCITNMTNGARSSVASLPPASDYPELTTPYSAVSSFNFSTRADSTLLTPISSSESPPIKAESKFTGRYPPLSGHTQDGPSSANPKMYNAWANHFDMNGQTTQTSSPMPPPATVAQDFLTTTYLPDDRRPTPGPPEHSYTGIYGVSEGTDHHGIQHQGSPYYMSMTSVEHHPSMLVRDDPSMALEADQDLSRTQMPNTPLLSQVHPPNVRERRLNGDIAIFPGDSASSRSTGANPRRRACAPRVRKQKTMIRKSKRSQSRITPMPLDPAEEHKNCVGREEPPHLKDTCPPEERCIFESRWRNRHKKGQDMWDSIQADFHEQFSKTHGKEMLQMKFKRARSKYYVWLPEDEDILRQAFMELEKSRYELLLDKFHELGGSRNMQLNAGDVEVKVVNDLKLEEGIYMDEYADVGVRRRRKLNSRKRMAGRGDESDLAPNNETAGAGTHQNGVSEDEVVRQVHKRRDMGWSDGSTLSPEIMDIQMEMKMEPGLVPEHVARQHHEAQRLRSSHYGQHKGV